MLQLENAPRVDEPKFNTLWLPLLVGMLIFTVIGLFSWGLYQAQNAELVNDVQSKNAMIATHIETDYSARVAALQRLSRQWEGHDGFTREEFTIDVQYFINDNPGFQAIEWVDSQYYVRWIVPLAGNEAAQNLFLGKEEKRLQALQAAKINQVPAMTDSVELVQGGKGFLIYFPVFKKGNFEGFILAVIRADDWFGFLLDSGENQSDLRSSISLDDQLIYQQNGWDVVVKYLGLKENEFYQLEPSTTFKLLNHKIKIVSLPTENYLTSQQIYLPQVIAFIGLILSLLVGAMVRLYQKTTSEAWRTFAAKSALESEIQDHQKTAGDLQYTLSRLDMATRAGGIGVWSWHVSTNFLTWNDQMFTMFGIPTDIHPVYETWRRAIHPDDLEATETLLSSAVEGKAVFNTEYRIILPNGEIRYIGAAARVERNIAGHPLRVNGISWDLTSLKQAEITSKKNEAQVLLLLNSTAEAIYGMDLNGNCTFANPSCIKLLGYIDASQLLGRNMHHLIHYTDVHGFPIKDEDCSIFLALRTGQDVHKDTEVFWRADGTSFPIEYWSYPQIANGLVTGAVVTFIDIAERKIADDLLTAERSRLRDILEGTNAGTWEWNIQTGETVFNERWAEIIGYTLEELQPVSIETWRNFTHTDDLQASTKLIEKNIRREIDYYECEVRMRHKDGHYVWVLDRGRIAAWAVGGKPLLMSGTHQDITERKVMENELRQSEAHNRALLGAIPDLILRIGRDGIIIDYKATSNDLLVFPEERIIGFPVSSILDEGSASEAIACIERALDTGHVQSMEFPLKLRESTHIFESRFKNSGTDEVMAIIRDISERTRLEQMKSDFINRATHELRTPVATMMLMVNLLESTQDKTEHDQYWGVLTSELQRERLLVEDLLSAGRLESDRYQFNFKPMEITSIINSSIQTLVLSAREKGLFLHIDPLIVQGNSHYLVKADESGLTQVFSNLLSNAIKFTPGGGEVDISMEEKKNGIEITIADNGMGIPSEDLPMLFNRFFRGSNAVSEEVQGTGIGLFIVRSILDKHAGKISLKSKLGKGSQFFVWLPLTNENGD